MKLGFVKGLGYNGHIMSNSIGNIEPGLREDTRAVFLGGFMNGQKTVDAVGNSLGEYYGRVEGFTFAWAMKHPGEVAKAIEDAEALTHSAGALALVYGLIADKSPNSARLIAPPVPVAESTFVASAKLVGRSGPKMIQTFTEGGFTTAASYNNQCMKELARHPVGNLKHLPEISRFNGFLAAADLVEAGTYYVGVDIMRRDAFFHEGDVDRAMGVASHRISDPNIIGIRYFDGQHDELALRPNATLAAIMEASV